ncbi:metalloregulator ArsR/SmtB family transcription factor [soil metagenome]
MARASTTADVFNAIAEPQRRRILNLLVKGERPVAQIVTKLKLTQPQVSKHLRVLRAVDLVRVRGDGQQRLYSLKAKSLKPIHDWVIGFEQFWNESFDRLENYLHTLSQKENGDDKK